MRLNSIGRSHAERRMGSTQMNQGSVVLEHFPVVCFARAVELIDSITCIITIAVATFRAEDLLSFLEKYYALRGTYHCLGQLVHHHPICLSIIWIAEGDLVPQGVVVMAGHVVDGFPWGGGEIVNTAFYSFLDPIDPSQRTCCEPSARRIKNASTEAIADMVVEDGHAQPFLLPLRELLKSGQSRSSTRPRLPIQQHIGI